MAAQSIFTSLTDKLVGPVIASFVFILVTLLFIGHLLPRFWTYIEWGCWRLLLGGSPASRVVISLAKKDFLASIRQREIDDGAPRPLAVILVLIRRPFQYWRLMRDFKRILAGMRAGVFESAIKSLNKGWRSGTPPTILDAYIKVIEDSQYDKAIDMKERLRGLSSVAMVKYTLGKLSEGQRLGKSNWDSADKLMGDDKTEVKWMASYAYFNSTMFLGDFEKAMIMMADQWSDYYAPLDPIAKKKIRDRLAEKITLNPVLVIPRHIILAAAFNDGPIIDGPILEERCWPSKTIYDGLPAHLSARDKELVWVEAWYDEAKRICADELISLNFSHAYAGFYFTLLIQETQESERLADLHRRINNAFNSIGDTSPIVSQYVKHGFSGVYHFACGENQKALDNLRTAAQISAISGNRFAECIFMCCHAVTAARLMVNEVDMYLEPEVVYYLKEAEKLAYTIGGGFYPALLHAAYSAVLTRQEKKGEAERYALKVRNLQAGRRILRMFQEDIHRM